MRIYYGKMSWDGCIFTFNVCFRKKNYDYLLEFETSRHYLTIYLFSAYPKNRGIIGFVDTIFSEIEESKYKKNVRYLNKEK